MSVPLLPEDAERLVADAATRGFRVRVWRVHWREVAPTDSTLSQRTTGRYHRGLDRFPVEQTWPALYTSLGPEIAIWEMVRRSAARSMAFLRNNVLSEIEVDLGKVIDLSDPIVVGLTRGDLTGPDYRTCHELAAAAIAREREGILVPSAALPGLNLVLFPSRLRDPLPIRVLRSTELPLNSIVHEDKGRN